MATMNRTWILAAAVVGLVGCAHSSANVYPQLADEPYRIGREDVLDVAVWRDQDLSRVLPVRPDGFISLPIAGEIAAEGKTTLELEQAIKDKLTPYVQTPRVTVIVREVNSSRVFITGEVAHPGAFPLRGKVSLLQVIAMAGGFSEFANGDGMVVIRQGKNGGKIPVRYSDLTADDETHGDFILKAGDTVVVP